MKLDWNYLIPISVGIVSILQAGMNRQMGEDFGLFKTLLIGNVFILLLNLVLLLGSTSWFGPESFLSSKGSMLPFKWWYLFPGLCGLVIIIGFPLGISRLGAIKVTVTVVAVQLIASGFWDYFKESQEIGPFKILSMLLTVGAVVLASL